MNPTIRILSSLPAPHNLIPYWNFLDTDDPRHFLGVTFPLHRSSDFNYNNLPDLTKSQRGITDLSIFGRNMLPQDLEDFISRLILNANSNLLTSISDLPENVLYAAIIKTIVEDINTFRQPWFEHILIQLDGKMWKDIASSLNYKYHLKSPLLRNIIYSNLWDILGISITSANTIQVGLYLRSTELNKYRRIDYTRIQFETSPYKFLPLYDRLEPETINYAGKVKFKEHDLLTYGRIRMLLDNQNASLIVHPLVTSNLDEPYASAQILLRIISMVNFTLKSLHNDKKTALVTFCRNKSSSPRYLYRILQLNYLSRDDIKGIRLALNIKGKLPVLEPIKLTPIREEIKKYPYEDFVKHLYDILKDTSTKFQESKNTSNKYITSILPDIAQKLDRYRVWNLYNNNRTRPLYRSLIMTDITMDFILNDEAIKMCYI